MLYPTEAEYSNFHHYVRSIRGTYERYGIVKVVPPQGRGPRSVNVESTTDRGAHMSPGRFFTKRQAVHRLQEGVPFEDGGKYNAREYRRYAESFTAGYLRGHPVLQADHAAAAGPGEAALLRRAAVLEKEYWRLVETNTEEVEVDYANDIDLDITDTFFDKDQADIWDLNKIAYDTDSPLLSLDEMKGLTVPWMYFGNLFSTFCWHTEDHFLYSVNYMHDGAPKTWYGIPSSSAGKFETALAEWLPARLKENPDLIYQLVTFISPQYCKSQGVDVFHLVQEPGSYVITFPRAYHAGFSHGWNSAEAVNFATLDWFPFGRAAVERYHTKKAKRGALFSHDLLLWTVAWEGVYEDSKHKKEKSGEYAVQPEDWIMLYNELKAVWEYEQNLRSWLRSRQIEERHVCVQVQGAKGAKAEAECCVCQSLTTWSAVRCKRHGHVTCLNHAYSKCSCVDGEKVLEIRIADELVHELINILHSKVAALSRRPEMRQRFARPGVPPEPLAYVPAPGSPPPSWPPKEPRKRFINRVLEDDRSVCPTCNNLLSLSTIIECRQCGARFHRACEAPKYKKSAAKWLCPGCKEGEKRPRLDYFEAHDTPPDGTPDEAGGGADGGPDDGGEE